MDFTTNQPLVSTVMAAYNGEKYIREAIESVFAQTYPNIELIVVDDGSTDSTPDILRSYGDRLTYIRQENRGCGAARNAGLSRASGELVAILDCDDVWVQEKTGRQVRLFEALPHLDVVFGLAETMDELGAVRSVASGRPAGWALRRVKLPFSAYECCGDVLTRQIQSNKIMNCSAMIRRSTLVKLGGYDHSLLRCEDYDLWLRLAQQGSKFGFLGSITYRYRKNSDQDSAAVCRDKLCHVRALVKFLAHCSGPPAVRAAAQRAIGEKFKQMGDLAFGSGDTRQARRYYSNALRFYPRPVQRLSWALTFLGPLGLIGASVLNPRDETFA